MRFLGRRPAAHRCGRYARAIASTCSRTRRSAASMAIMERPSLAQDRSKAPRQFSATSSRLAGRIVMLNVFRRGVHLLPPGRVHVHRTSGLLAAVRRWICPRGRVLLCCALAPVRPMDRDCKRPRPSGVSRCRSKVSINPSSAMHLQFVCSWCVLTVISPGVVISFRPASRQSPACWRPFAVLR